MFYIVYGKDKYLINTGHFPDGTLSMKLNNAPMGADQIQWYYENDSELFTLICLRNYYNTVATKLYMPYIPHARMDRVRNYGDVFTLKAFAKVINDMKFSAVIVRDPHSPVAEALFNNIEIEKADDYIKDAVYNVAMTYKIEPKDVRLFFPDEGAMKRYMNILPNQYAFGIKNRDWTTGNILNLQIVVPNGVSLDHQVCLIVDDICSRGGTFYHAAKALDQYGVKNINLYVTHLEPSVFEGDMYQRHSVEYIFTTQSIFMRKYLDRDYQQMVVVL